MSRHSFALRNSIVEEERLKSLPDLLDTEHGVFDPENPSASTNSWAAFRIGIPSRSNAAPSDNGSAASKRPTSLEHRFVFSQSIYLGIPWTLSFGTSIRVYRIMCDKPGRDPAPLPTLQNETGITDVDRE